MNAACRTTVLVGTILLLLVITLPVQAEQHVTGNQAVASRHAPFPFFGSHDASALLQTSPDTQVSQPHTQLAEGTFDGESPLMVVLIALGIAALGRALLKQAQG